MDFSKAFDRAPHARLERKLKSHGIGGDVSDWITKWFTDREQRVVVNGQNSGYFCSLGPHLERKKNVHLR